MKRKVNNTNGRKTNFLSPQPKAPVIRESGLRLNYQHVQNILSGKTGTEDINLFDYRKISFVHDSHNVSSEVGKNRIWGEMLNYTKGSQKDGKFNHFIYLEKVRKEIYQAIKETIPHHEMFLNNYNIYKSFLIQKLVLPVLGTNKTEENQKKMKLMTDIIADKEYFESLKERIETFQKTNNE